MAAKTATNDSRSDSDPPAPRSVLSLTLVDNWKNGPLGGMVGAIVAAGIVWFAPTVKPVDWTDQTFIAFGLATGLVLNRAAVLAGAWFFGPAVRHLTARWNATIALGKLAHYRKTGVLDPKAAKKIATQIARTDVDGRV